MTQSMLEFNGMISNMESTKELLMDLSISNARKTQAEASLVLSKFKKEKHL
jgi:hypothetical protein